LGTNRLTLDDVPKLVYIDQILKETLRVYPTAPTFTVCSDTDTVLAGKYQIKKTDDLVILIPTLHRDPTVWGQYADDFNPDNFAPEKVGKLPPNAFKPFGNGMRACIGRYFALQEATMVLAQIIQQFDLIEEDPSYQLKIKEQLTIKPYNFKIRARPRGTMILSAPILQSTQMPLVPVSPVTGETPLLVLFGSNSGSSESFASRIASGAKAQGETFDFSCS
jgi:cytochrome P450/NADPH-cytochrome P450 reductase